MKKKQESDRKRVKAKLDKQSIIVISFIVVVIMGFLFYTFWDAFNRIPVEIGENEQVPNELVCMVNDAFMGIEQIPVEVEGKIYYGCCQACVTKLQSNQGNVRYIIDSYSKAQVDKSEAFIVLKPDGKGAVLYFKSEENFNTFRLGNLDLQ